MMQPPRGNGLAIPARWRCEDLSTLYSSEGWPTREGSFRRLDRGKIVDRRVGEARELRQRERQFLGHRPPISIASPVNGSKAGSFPLNAISCSSSGAGPK